MTAEQAELNLRTKAARVVNRDSIEEFCQLLRHRGWMTVKRIQWHRPDWNERFIRLLANASKGRVLSHPGSAGYRLTIEASAEERERAIAKFRHQAVQMGERANDIAHVHHRCQREP